MLKILFAFHEEQMTNSLRTQSFESIRLSTDFFRFSSIWSYIITFVLGSLSIMLVVFLYIYLKHVSRPISKRIKHMTFESLEDVICLTNTGIWQINMQTGALMINAEMPYLAEIPQDKTRRTLDYIIRNIFHPEDWAIAEQNINSVLAGNEPFFVTEIRVKSREGGYFWTTIRGTVLKRTKDKKPLTIGGTLQDTSLRKERELEIQRLSYYDALTGLKNRRAYENAVLNYDITANLPISIISADVNGLKIINDAFGHNVGDQLLIDTANILKSTFLCIDCIFRIGGDEFVVILPKTSELEAKNSCDIVRSEVEKHIYHGIQASISIGFKTKTTDTEDLKQLLINAEVEMYHSKLQASWKNRGDIIRGILSTLYTRNKELEEHSIHVAELSYKIGVMLALSNEELDSLKIAAEFHDIGKIAIDDHILSKYRQKTPDETDQFSQHVEYGYRILAGSNEYEKIARDVLFHHENWDGSGYPKGLKGGEIPLFSRIIHLAEAYDWMSRKLPYRKPFTKAEIKEDLLKDSGTKLDPELVKLFISAFLR